MYRPIFKKKLKILIAIKEFIFKKCKTLKNVQANFSKTSCFKELANLKETQNFFKNVPGNF